MNYIITHTDLDGAGAAILSKLLWCEDEVSIVFSEAFEVDKYVEEILKEITSDDFLYIVDCAPSPDMMLRLNQVDFKRVLLDHHSPKFEVENYPWAYVFPDGVDSGTSLFYKYFQSSVSGKVTGFDSVSLIEPFDIGVTYDFVELVRKYDTWEWVKDSEIKARDLNQLFFVMGMNAFVEHCVICLQNGEDPLNDFAKQLIYYKDLEIQRYIKAKLEKVQYMNIDGIKFGIVLAESYKSQLANEIMNTCGVNAAAIVGNDGVSLRSKGDIDVSVIAKKYGGGGRLNTAGFRIDEDIKQRYISRVFGQAYTTQQANKMNLV